MRTLRVCVYVLVISAIVWVLAQAVRSGFIPVP